MFNSQYQKMLIPGVDKTKNNSGGSPLFSGASIFILQIRAKKTMNQTKINLKI
jgi:hypothetical protein